MKRAIIGVLAAGMSLLTGSHHGQAQTVPAETAGSPAKVVVIPVRSQIAKPALYILRRGIKDAISNEVDTVVLDMETPGGRLDVTFDILKALERFPGKTVTYINREAISAGALISAGTDEIWFSPKGVIGAAAPVLSTGGEIDPTMREKIVSYLKARVRAISEGQGYRGEVISAMIDSESEFKIGDEVIKEKGELLSLTASEAMAEYGTPPHRLLAAGVAEDLADLLDQLHGAGNHTVTRLDPSWSEEVAQFLTAITPLLLAAGLFGLIVEFKTPGFGIFGIAGLLLLCVVFFGHHVAGLSGYEPLLILLLGVLLVLAEVLFFPGTIVPSLVGILMIFGSLVWAMLDIWPNEPLSISGDMLKAPLLNLLLGVAGAVVLFVVTLRFLPASGPWSRLILNAAVAGEPGGIHPLHGHGEAAADDASLVGRSGVAATDLYPSGQVEISGKRYEARLAVGSADAGTPLVVTGISEFGLNVEVQS